MGPPQADQHPDPEDQRRAGELRALRLNGAVPRRGRQHRAGPTTTTTNDYTELCYIYIYIYIDIMMIFIYVYM